MKRVKILVIYFLISCLFTFPLILNLKKILIGWPLDAYNYLWNIDTFWKQVFSFQNPFFTNRIFYPLGVSLLLHTYAPVISLVGLPFLKILPLYLNVLVLISTSLSAFCMFLLVKYITKNNFSSFLSGFTYGFSPIMISFLVSQHYYFAFAAFCLPLTIYYLTKFYDSSRTRFLIITCFLFWICIGIDYYSGVVLTIIIAIFSIFYMAFKKDLWKFAQKNYKKMLIIGMFLVLIPASFLFYIFIKSDNSYLSQKSYYPTLCSANIKKLIIPSQFNPILKDLSNSLDNKFHFSTNYDTPSLYLGVFTVLLATSSLIILSPRKVLHFLAPGIFILLFSLGPSTKLFSIFSSLPFLGLIDCPQRYIIGVQFSLAVLAGLSLSKILTSKTKTVLKILIAIILFIDYFTFNLPSSVIKVPQIYRELSLIKSNRTVLELPSGIADSKGAFGYDWSIQGLLLKEMYWQIVSGKNRVGGYVSRLDNSYYKYYENENILSDLFQLSSLNGYWRGNNYSRNEVNSFIEKFNLGYIILSPNSRQEEFSQIIEKVFGSKISQKISEEEYILYVLN